MEKNSIEEDIKILEELLDEGFEAMCYEEAQAIKHILSDYKRVLEENELLRQQNISYKNNIHDLKEVRNKWTRKKEKL